MTQKILILGSSGTIGSAVAKAFETAGWEIHKFNRKSEDMAQQATDVDVIFNGLNPPNYEDWENNLPKIAQQVIAAAKINNATILLPGNVYIYDAKPGLWPNDTTPNPASNKGHIRQKMENMYRDTNLQTIILRAGDFISPDERHFTSMRNLILSNAKRGKIQAAGPHDTRRAYAYTPDLARAFVALAEQRGHLAQFNDIPFEGHSLSYKDIAQTVERIVKKPMRLSKFPWWIVWLSRPFSNLMREFYEMKYLFETDHMLSNDAFARLVPELETTALDVVMGSQINQISDRPK